MCERRLTGVAVLTLLVSVAAYGDPVIDGVWSSATRSKGGLGSQWVFTKNGTTTYSFGALVDFTYEIDGEHIHMILLNEFGVPTDNVTVQKFSAKDDTITIYREESGEDRIMERVGRSNPDSHPIVGVWTFTHFTGGPAILRYRKSGRGQLSVPFEYKTGIYQVNGDEISIFLDDIDPYRNKIDISQDTITFAAEDSSTAQTYVRLE